MTRKFRSLTPKPGRGDSTAPRTPGKPIGKDRLDAAAERQAETGTHADDAGRPKEIGGPEGPEPTRYGDWERGGVCYDF